MCAAAIWWARIDRVFYGNLLSHAADLGIDIAGLEGEVATPSEQRGRPYRRLLGDETYASVQGVVGQRRPHDHLNGACTAENARAIYEVSSTTKGGDPVSDCRKPRSAVTVSWVSPCDGAHG